MRAQEYEGSQDDVVQRIAREKLGIETLVTRNSDSLDFHDCSVWRIETALKLAYAAGYAANEQEVNDSGKRDDTSKTTDTDSMEEQIVEMEAAVVDAVVNYGIEPVIAALRDACRMAADVAKDDEEWTQLSMALHYSKGLSDLLGED